MCIKPAETSLHCGVMMLYCSPLLLIPPWNRNKRVIIWYEHDFGILKNIYIYLHSLRLSFSHEFVFSWTMSVIQSGIMRTSCTLNITVHLPTFPKNRFHTLFLIFQGLACFHEPPPWHVLRRRAVSSNYLIMCVWVHVWVRFFDLQKRPTKRHWQKGGLLWIFQWRVGSKEFWRWSVAENMDDFNHGLWKDGKRNKTMSVTPEFDLQGYSDEGSWWQKGILQFFPGESCVFWMNQNLRIISIRC